MPRGNQLKRQWQLLQILQSHKYGVIIDDLEAKAECCRRTIERDLDILHEVGFPVSYEIRETGKKFWKLEQKFLESDKFIFEPTELMGLYLARKSISRSHGSPFGDGVEKLCSKIEKLLPAKALSYFSDLDEKIYIKNAVVSNADDAKQLLLHQINEAIDNSKVLTISYKSTAKTSEFLYHPYGMVILNDSTYLLGYAEHVKAIRMLKLQRIKSIGPTAKKFRRPEDFSISKYFGGSFGIFYNENPPTTVRCRLEGWAAQIVREQKFHKTQTIEEDNGKELVVSFLLTSTTEFKQWLLGMGPLAKVLEPAFLKRDVAKLISQMRQNYL